MSNLKEQYLNDMKSYLGTGTHNKLMLAILERVDENNEIVLLKPLKEEISKETGLNVTTINSRIPLLIASGLIIRKSTLESKEAVYVLNPDIFGNKNWNEIKKISINIEYDLSKNKRNKDIKIEYKG
ncbi:replication/maintenance protein RepL [Campylobacter sp. RM16187]|uniref:replication/maintenance protein RepL n=1 Tax=Campylobacter sp. RM16187 TaxID=1660063 RepID=UPI0021B5FCE8|nr:replication/maintenance protein RepL [Campylobacter sp. RM16187]QKG30279.1 hypothetical protein CDOMF_a030 [Campylobacter sp. RM16187]